MKLTQILLATTFAAATATTFAAPAAPANTQTEDKVIVSTQDQPVAAANAGAADQPASEAVSSDEKEKTAR